MLRRTLYDFNESLSSFQSKFIDKIDLESVKIDTLRGICTASALIRLNKIAKITKAPQENAYRLDNTGIRLKLKKLYRQDKFQIEVFAIAQYYKLTARAQKRHKEVLNYLLTKKSFDFTEADLCLDTQEYLESKPATQSKVYKTTIYKNYEDGARLCIYDKSRKESQKSHTNRIKSNTTRYELTLKLAKKQQAAKPPKALKQVKSASQGLLNKKYTRLYKNKLKYKNTREFITKISKLDSS